MKKRLIFLYILLFLILAVLAWSLFAVFSMDLKPETPELYSEYKEQQEQVEVKTAGLDESGATEPDDSVYLDFDVAALLEINSDFADWLMIPDTSISFPVVRTDNNDYYLYRDFNKDYNHYGCLFYDVLSVPDAENSVIYGHNMGVNREEMFSPLVQYQDQAFADTHIFAYLSSSPDVPAEVYELYAVVNLNIYKDLSFDYAQPYFEDEEDRASFISYLQDRSIYETDFIPSGDLLILSTCNRQYGGNNRLLICFGERETPLLSCTSDFDD